MSWCKVDDQFADHPKFVGLSNDAVALWLRALAYCNRHMTDGRIPAAAVPAMAKHKRPQLVVDELVSVRLWTVAGSNYEVHDFLALNDSKADRERKRNESIDRQQRWRDKSGTFGRRERNASRDALVTTTSETHSLQPPYSDSDSDSDSEDLNPFLNVSLSRLEPAAAPGDSPAEPAPPDPRRATSVEKLGRRRKIPCPPSTDAAISDWLVDQGLPPLSGPNGGQVAIMLDHHASKDTRSADWAATWRAWQARGERMGATSNGPAPGHRPRRERNASREVNEPVNGAAPPMSLEATSAQAAAALQRLTNGIGRGGT